MTHTDPAHGTPPAPDALRLVAHALTTRPGAPWVLDLGCGAGGMAWGLYLAGFNVVGIDLLPQPHFPFWFIQGDMFKIAPQVGQYFDLIHASPPCQGYSHSTRPDSPWVSYSRGKDTPRLINETRALLEKLGKPYVIENVSGSQVDLRASLMLCGSMFPGDLPARHRFFEVSHLIPQPPHYHCTGHNIRLAARLGVDPRDVRVAGKSRRAGSLDTWRHIMGTYWMEHGYEIVEAVPPVFGWYIGVQMRRAVQNTHQHAEAAVTR